MSEASGLQQALAVRTEDDKGIINVDESTVKLVLFVLGKDWFAFYGEQIKEIINAPTLFFLPGAPAWLEGVINVRGDIESVLNLRQVLRYPPVAPDAVSRILLAQGTQMRSGVRVDRVEEVVDVIERNILPPTHTIPEHLRELVLGHLEFAGQVVSLLDLDRLFASQCGAGA